MVDLKQTSLVGSAYQHLHLQLVLKVAPISMKKWRIQRTVYGWYRLCPTQNHYLMITVGALSAVRLHLSQSGLVCWTANLTDGNFDALSMFQF